MPLYLYLLAGSLIIPLLFSVFCIDFIKDWKNFSISTLSVAIIFLIWDAIFTHYKIWGFNPDYCLELYLLKMPLEELLFFLIIPFCSLFTHFALFYAKPDLKLSDKTTQYLSWFLIVTSAIMILLNHSKAYTCVNFSFFLVTLLAGIRFHKKALSQFYISFLIILIPFFIVNGVLTGIATDLPVVWYDNAENLGIRLGTIPIEDTAYAFTMLFGNLMIFESLRRR